MSMIHGEFDRLVDNIKSCLNSIDYETDRSIKHMKEVLNEVDCLRMFIDKLTTKDEEDTE